MLFIAAADALLDRDHIDQPGIHVKMSLKAIWLCQHQQRACRLDQRLFLGIKIALVKILDLIGIQIVQTDVQLRLAAKERLYI